MTLSSQMTNAPKIRVFRRLRSQIDTPYTRIYSFNSPALRGEIMERRKFLQGAGMAGILAAGTAPAIVHAPQQIR